MLQVLNLITLLVEAGYLNHGDRRFDALERRKCRPTIKLTHKSRDVLSDPLNSTVKVKAIRHPRLVDDTSSHNDGIDGIDQLISLSKEGILVIPAVMKGIMEDSTHKGFIKINKVFPAESSISASMIEIIAAKENNNDGELGEEDIETKQVVDNFIHTTELPDVRNAYKTRPSSHQNIDADLFRTCKQMNCRHKCRDLSKLCNINFLENRKVSS